MPAEPRPLQQPQQRSFLVVRQPAAQQRRELRDGFGGHPSVRTHVVIPCGAGAFVGGFDDAGAEPLRPRIQIAHVGVRPLVVLADLGQHVAGHREDRRDEDVLDGEAHHLGQQLVVVAGGLHLLQQPQVAVVLAVATAAGWRR